MKTMKYAFFVLAVLFAASCKEKVKPLSERIAKTWTAKTVKQDANTVYTKGGTSNIVPGYSSYSLTLSPTGTATLREVDGNTFTGNWELVGTTTLVLTNLSPQPTQSNGRLEYTIVSITDTELVLTGKFAYAKTGGTTNTYTLETSM